MWKPISAQTRGFLSLLGLKNTGRNPGVLLDDVRPALEMAPWYLASSAIQRTVAVTSVAIARGIIVQLLVPEDQTWWIHGVSGDVGGRIGDLSGPASVQGCCAFARYPAPVADLYGPSVTYEQAAPINPSPLLLTIPTFGGFFAPGGTILGLFGGVSIQNSLTNENWAATLYARYSPLVT